MYRPRSWLLLLLLLPLLPLAGCYHATVETGRPPSGVVVERPWAHSFIAGLVPPATVEAAGRCPDGIARVDTELSFLNLFVGVMTSGIYTPMSIRVQCAAAPRAGAVLDGSADPLAAVQRAAERSRERGETVFVRF